MVNRKFLGLMGKALLRGLNIELIYSILLFEQFLIQTATHYGTQAGYN